MLTAATLTRLWQNARYRRLCRELLAGRPEASMPVAEAMAGPLCAAALGLLRLGELAQTDLPIAKELRGRLLRYQARDGSFGEGSDRPVFTAFCVRGLCAVQRTAAEGAWTAARKCGLPGQRLRLGMFDFGSDVAPAGVERAISRGVEFLASAQHPDGGWGDELATAFVLLQLGRFARFHDAIRVSDALRRRHGSAACDSAARLAWSRVGLRCGRALRQAAMKERGTVGPRHRAAELFANVA